MLHWTVWVRMAGSQIIHVGIKQIYLMVFSAKEVNKAPIENLLIECK